MAESALRKALIKKFQLPSTRKGFIEEFDGNVDGLSRLQMDIESSGSEEMKQLFQDAVDNSGGDDAGIIDELVNSLYPQKTGARGKTAPVAEKVESNLPPSTADQGTLDATPYESLSNTDRTKLTAAGFPSADVSTWSAEDLLATLDSIDGTRQTGGKKSTAGKAAAKATPAAKPAAPKAAAQAQTQRASGPAPAATVADVMPSREAVFSTSTDPADLLSTAQAGQTPDSELNRVLNMPPAPPRLTRADVASYLDGSGDFIEAPPPVMDMSALSGLPTMQELLAGIQPASPRGMDMNALSNLPSLRELLMDIEPAGPPELAGPYRTGQFDSEFRQMTPMPESAPAGTIRPDGGFGGADYGPSPINAEGGYLAGEYGPTVFNKDGGYAIGGEMGPTVLNRDGGYALGDYGPPRPSPDNRPLDPSAPLTSRMDKFFESRGYPKGAFGMNYVTKPADFAYRNAIPLAAGAGTLAAMRSANQGSGVTQEQMDGATSASEQSEKILNDMFGPEAMEMYKQRAIQNMQQEAQGRSL